MNSLQCPTIDNSVFIRIVFKIPKELNPQFESILLPSISLTRECKHCLKVSLLKDSIENILIYQYEEQWNTLLQLMERINSPDFLIVKKAIELSVSPPLICLSRCYRYCQNCGNCGTSKLLSELMEYLYYTAS